MRGLLARIFNLITGAFTVGSFCFMLFTLSSAGAVDNTEKTFLGYRIFIVTSGSMSATDFDTGDIVFVKSVDPSTLQAGDIIAFTSYNRNSFGETVTHKIREITTDEKGRPVFVTYGTTTDTNDETPVSYSQIIGKYAGRMPGVGTVFQKFREDPNYVLLILVPLVLIILYQGFEKEYY